MMHTRVMLTSIALSFATLFAPTAEAQTASATTISPQSRRFVEGYYSHYQLDVPDDRIGMNGFGARFMWRPSSPDLPSAASRFAIGLFGEYAPEQDKGFSVGHVGAQADMNVFATPLFGRVSPVLSLGAGGFWTDRKGPAIDSPEFSIANKSVQSFALTPALGTYVGLWRQLGLRADVRDVITFEEESLHHLQITAGLSLPF